MGTECNQFIGCNILYVLDDIVDRGQDSCKNFLDMMCHFNIISLLGKPIRIDITKYSDRSKQNLLRTIEE